MASLGPMDYFSRPRSKSPGGRNRDRSRSRDSRRMTMPSRKPSRFYDDESFDEDPRLAEPSRRDKSRSRYDDESADDDIYRGLAKSKRSSGRYYLSDEEDSPPYAPAAYAASSSIRRSKSGASRGSRSQALEGPLYDSEREQPKRYSSRKLKPERTKSSRYRKYAPPVPDTDEEDEEENSEDGEDDVLAYGAKDYYGYPPSRRHRSQSRGRRSKPSEKLYYVEDSDGSPGYNPRPASRSRTRDDPSRHQSRHDAAVAAAAAATAQNRADHDKYLRQLRNLDPDQQSGAARSRSRRRSKSVASVPPAPEVDEDWAEIPECERPDFVPPPQAPDPTPVGVRPPSSSGSKYFSRIPGLGGLFSGNGSSQTPAANPSSPGGGKSYLSPHYAAGNQQSQQVPPPPPPPPNPAMQYPSIPPSQFVQQQYSNPQTPVSATSYEYGHHRAGSVGGPPTPQRQYAHPQQYKYQQIDPDIKYTNTPVKPSLPTESKIYSKPTTSQTPDPTQFLEPKPRRRRSHAARPHSYSFSGAPPSSEQMNVPGGFPDPGPPPGSPLVEPYQRPSAKGSKSYHDGLVEDDFVSSSDLKRSNSKAKRSNKEKEKEKLEKWVKLNRQTGSLESMTSSKPPQEPLYDPKPDAKTLKTALSAHSRADAKPLIMILPYLTSEEMAALRTEYRSIMRVNGRAINLAKHVGARVTGSFGKACHATALGQWESEAYWVVVHRANPQRREILIETLVGRSNGEIEKIKASFRDQYGENLEKAMKSELKPDKFRMAILLALAEARQPDNAPIDQELVRDDVRSLRRALAEGSEMDLLQIVLLRGDSHLREVLHVYKGAFKENFAREMINKSRNVVGEILLHVVNGALNRPMRDAILLHQAIAESEPGRDRAELLISRLVRLHWDPEHLEHVKDEYHKRYGKPIEAAIHDEILAPNAAANGGGGSGGGGGGGSGGRNADWVQFCIELVKSSTFHAGNDNAS